MKVKDTGIPSMRAAWPGALAAALTLAGCALGSPAAAGTTVRTSSVTASAAATAASTPASSLVSSLSAQSSEQPVASEQNPAGDIPDAQAFVAYHAPNGGYQLDVPEGWARTTTAAEVRFVDKLDGLQVAVAPASTAPSATSARGKEVSALEQSGRAVEVRQVKDIQLPGGPAVFVDYTSNSEPNPVTGKQVRLENNAYLLFSNGTLATLTLWAPLGADNVDQWQRIARSFRWG